MTQLLVGLFLTVVGFLASIMSLQYVVGYWYSQRLEGQKLNESFLVDFPFAKDKHKFKSEQKLKAGLDFFASPFFKNSERQIVPLQQPRKYPEWLLVLAVQLDLLRKEKWRYLPNLIAKFLGKPIPFPISSQKEASKTLFDKISNQAALAKVDGLKYKKPNNSKLPNNPPNNSKSKSTDLSFPPKAGNNIVQDEKTSKEVTKSNTNKDISKADKKIQGATIGLVNRGEENKDLEESKQAETEEQSVLARIEKRLLAKLKEEGLNRYDIWLELGDVYDKYGEHDKAREVYALVLKHGSELDKKRAVERLISLSY